jgi:small Trp-rich protein
MYLVIVGVIVIILNLAGIGPMAAWNWQFFGDLWKFCVPFLIAVVWWGWADSSGWTKRREMEKMDQKRIDRRAKNLDDLGMGPKKKGR